MRTLIHLSDTHILPTEAERLHGVDTVATLRQVLQMVQDSGIRPDALIVSGDLANQGEAASYKRLRAELEPAVSAMGTELVVAIGNHDSRPSFHAAMLDQPPTEDPVEYVRWIGGLRLIVLDSTVPGAPHGKIRPEQLTWLADVLSTPAAEGTVVVMHHPPVPDPTPLAELLVLHGADELEWVIRDSDVVAVLAGHAHHPITCAFGGALCYAAPATAYTVDPLVLANRTLRGVQGAGFGLLRVFDKHAVAVTVSMPSSGEETYQHELSDEILNRLIRGNELPVGAPAA